MQSGQLDTSLRLVEAQLEQCSFAGKRYPAGSIVSLSDGNDLRCELPKDKATASWVEIKPEKSKKSVVTKRKSNKPKPPAAESDQLADDINGERLF
jgi:hypothetical protein